MLVGIAGVLKVSRGAPLVELVGDDYKELIDKLGYILWSELEDMCSSRIKLTIKVEEL